MEIIKIIFYTLVALFILVTFHEFGHYWVARRCGVKVLRFSIGFGKPLLKWQRGDTEFVLAGIPLGGYVKMYGETADDETDEADRHLSFTHKTVWQRMAIVVAGPVANFLLAIFLYFLFFLGGSQGLAPIVGHVVTDSAADKAGIFAQSEIIAVDGSPVTTWSEVVEQLMDRIGESGQVHFQLQYADSGQSYGAEVAIENWLGDTDEPDFLGSIGLELYMPEYKAIVGQVMPKSPAEIAGLQEGDLIVDVAETSVENWSQWVELVRASPNQPLGLLIERDGDILQMEITPELIDQDGEQFGRVGVGVYQDWPDDLLRERHYGIGEAISAGVEKTWTTSALVLNLLKKLLTGQVSTKSIGGPISIAKVAGDSANAGWQAFISFMAFLSVMLGVMNLLPIPVLDGGHLLFYIIEAIKGSPLSEAIQGAAMRFGMLIVFGIMSLALYNDFMRL